MIKLPSRVWGYLDQGAHMLYLPTAHGRRCGRVRWHHRLHLLPGPVLGWVCNRYDTALGVYDEDDLKEVEDA